MLLSEALEVQKYRVITFIGGGGKTSTMFALANELQTDGNNLLLTTTTRMGLREVSTNSLLIRKSLAELSASLAEFNGDSSLRVLGRETSTKDDKLVGIPHQWVDALADDFPEIRFLIEGDGAARKPFKAPAEHEPVIPLKTDLVVGLVGVDALGVPLCDSYIHRAELVSRLTGLGLKETLTPEAVAQVLMHPLGYKKNSPSSAQYTVVINKVETEENYKKAVELAQLLLKKGCSRVILSAVQHEDKIRRIFTQ